MTLRLFLLGQFNFHNSAYALAYAYTDHVILDEQEFARKLAARAKAAEPDANVTTNFKPREAMSHNYLNYVI